MNIKFDKKFFKSFIIIIWFDFYLGFKLLNMYVFVLIVYLKGYFKKDMIVVYFCDILDNN